MSKFLILSLILLIAVFFQASHFLALGGVNPNLVLIALLLILFSHIGFGIKALNFLALLLMVWIYWLFWFDFWLTPLLFLTILLIFAFGLRKYLTGDKLVDFSLNLAVLTIVFYALMFLFKIGNFHFVLVGGELLYNIALGLIFWLLAYFFTKFHKLS